MLHKLLVILLITCEACLITLALGLAPRRVLKNIKYKIQPFEEGIRLQPPPPIKIFQMWTRITFPFPLSNLRNLLKLINYLFKLANSMST